MAHKRNFHHIIPTEEATIRTNDDKTPNGHKSKNVSDNGKNEDQSNDDDDDIMIQTTEGKKSIKKKQFLYANIDSFEIKTNYVHRNMCDLEK